MVIDLRFPVTMKAYTDGSPYDIEATVVRTDGKCFPSKGPVDLIFVDDADSPRPTVVNGVFTVVGEATLPQFRYVVDYKPNSTCQPITLLMNVENLGRLIMYWKTNPVQTYLQDQQRHERKQAEHDRALDRELGSVKPISG